MKKQPITAALIFFLGLAVPAGAQMPVPPPAPVGQMLSDPDLDQLLGPIALYPDPLLAEILPAATFPSQVVLANQYVNGGGDPNLIDQQNWDNSVRALARYPSILSMMEGNLAWTTEMGQAFLYQQPEVMASIQRLRSQAQALGNLQPTPQENVIIDDGDIEILPADENMIYVPEYQPDLVYFQRPYGGSFFSFGTGIVVGSWFHHDFDWHNHHLLEWDREHPRPSGWWSGRPGGRPPREMNNAPVWQPRDHPRVVAVPRNDRGWNIGGGREAIINRPVPGPARPRELPEPVVRENRPAMERRVETPGPRPATGALMGIQSSRETYQNSSRGQESRQSVSRSPGKR
jgi:hypothetical protein